MTTAGPNLDSAGTPPVALPSAPEILTPPKTADFGRMFTSYQSERIHDVSRYMLDEKARRIGLTFAYAYKYTLKRAATPGKTWYTANDASTVLEFIEYIGYFARRLNASFDVYEAPVVADESAVLTKVVRFAGAGQVNGLSSNPTALHGKGGDVILDEFAYHHRAQTMWEAAQASAAWGHDIVVLSTHTGFHSQFNRLVTQARNVLAAAAKAGVKIRERFGAIERATEDYAGFAVKRQALPWSYRRTTLRDAVAGGFVEKLNEQTRGAHTREGYILECRAKCLGEDQWKRQYECEPSSDASALLPYDLILPCVAEDCLKPLAGCATIFQGCDFARRGANTSVASGELLGDVLWVRDLFRLKGAAWSEQMMRIGAIAGLPNFRHGCYDQTGMGDMPVEELQRRHGSWRVEGVRFTQQAKANLANQLRRRFEDRTIRIPNDQALFESLNKIHAVTTADGRTLFEADEANGEHGDDFWALALLNEAARTARQPFAYASVTPPDREHLRQEQRKGVTL
jgi:phage FluMu gp28-like protein